MHQCNQSAKARGQVETGIQAMAGRLQAGLGIEWERGRNLPTEGLLRSAATAHICDWAASSADGLGAGWLDRLTLTAGSTATQGQTTGLQIRLLPPTRLRR